MAHYTNILLLILMISQCVYYLKFSTFREVLQKLPAEHLHFMCCQGRQGQQKQIQEVLKVGEEGFSSLRVLRI